MGSRSWGKRPVATGVAVLFSALMVLAAIGGPASATARPARRTPATDSTAPVLTPQSSAYLFTMTVDGRSRGYRLHVPPAAASGARLPLVVNLHGATQNGLLQEAQSGMDAASNRDGYLVAYPDGTRISTVLSPDPIAGDAQYGWNAGACCGLPIETHVDDVKFLKLVIADIARRTPVDLRRVYMTGMSNGGMMAYTMAAKAPERVAAISSVAGQVQLSHIRPRRAVPTIEFHSVNDPIAKWDGVDNANPRLRYSVLDGVQQWVRADWCRPSPRLASSLQGAVGTNTEGLTATLVTYRPCRGGVEVALWILTGSGHVWPGAPFNTGPPETWILDGVGRGTTLIDANAQMWSFFQRYALPRR